jgi:hypothetical protein
MYHWINYIVVYFLEDPQECSTAGVSLQLHRSRQCGPYHSTTGSRSRSFIGCRPSWKSTSTNSLESRCVWGAKRRWHRRGCVPQHGNVFDSAGTNILSFNISMYLVLCPSSVLSSLPFHATLLGWGREFSATGRSTCDSGHTTSTSMPTEGSLHPEW